jgi:hypothetical protein
VVEVSGVDRDGDGLNFDVVWTHGLLFDVCKGGDAALFDDDCLHDSSTARYGRIENWLQ